MQHIQGVTAVQTASHVVMSDQPHQHLQLCRKRQNLTVCPSCVSMDGKSSVRGHVGLFIWDNPSTLPHGRGETFLSIDFSFT